MRDLPLPSFPQASEFPRHSLALIETLVQPLHHFTTPEQRICETLRVRSSHFFPEHTVFSCTLPASKCILQSKAQERCRSYANFGKQCAQSRRVGFLESLFSPRSHSFFWKPTLAPSLRAEQPSRSEPSPYYDWYDVDESCMRERRKESLQAATEDYFAVRRPAHTPSFKMRLQSSPRREGSQSRRIVRDPA